MSLAQRLPGQEARAVAALGDTLGGDADGHGKEEDNHQIQRGHHFQQHTLHFLSYIRAPPYPSVLCPRAGRRKPLFLPEPIDKGSVRNEGGFRTGGFQTKILSIIFLKAIRRGGDGPQARMAAHSGQKTGDATCSRINGFTASLSNHSRQCWKL